MSESPAMPRVPRVGPTCVPRRLMLACAAALAVAAVWAFRPLPPPPVPSPLEEPAASAAPIPVRLALDMDAFRAPIWVHAPPPPELPAEVPPPPPLKIQLLAILRDGGVYRAALYDPDADRLFVVASGESVAGRTVDQVLADAVTLREGNGGGVRTLTLAAGGPP